jgi:hypothetical protein
MAREQPGGWLIRDPSLDAVGFWAAASGAGLLAADLISPAAGIAVAAIAAILAVAGLGERPVVCLAVMVGLVPMAVAATPAALAWIAAGSLIASAVSLEGHRAPVRMDNLRRHISAARRRDEQVDLVVFRLDGADLAESAMLLESFRLTDSVEVQRMGAASEVRIVLDHVRLERSGVERRIATQLGTSPRFGWATFPDDGLALETLIETARRGWLADEERSLRDPQPSPALGAVVTVVAAPASTASSPASAAEAAP